MDERRTNAAIVSVRYPTRIVLVNAIRFHTVVVEGYVWSRAGARSRADLTSTVVQQRLIDRLER
jgi:hypothetical protein